jgi:hypothetical protein
VSIELPEILSITGTVHTGMLEVDRRGANTSSTIRLIETPGGPRAPPRSRLYVAAIAAIAADAPHIGLFATPAVADRAIARAGALTSKDGAARG